MEVGYPLQLTSLITSQGQKFVRSPHAAYARPARECRGAAAASGRADVLAAFHGQGLCGRCRRLPPFDARSQARCMATQLSISRLVVILECHYTRRFHKRALHCMKTLSPGSLSLALLLYYAHVHSDIASHINMSRTHQHRTSTSYNLTYNLRISLYMSLSRTRTHIA